MGLEAQKRDHEFQPQALTYRMDFVIHFRQNLGALPLHMIHEVRYV